MAKPPSVKAAATVNAPLLPIIERFMCDTHLT
jgi:hypothetical protein